MLYKLRILITSVIVSGVFTYVFYFSEFVQDALILSQKDRVRAGFKMFVIISLVKYFVTLFFIISFVFLIKNILKPNH